MFFRSILFLLLINMVSSSFGQDIQPFIDSLRQEVKNDQIPDSVKIQYLNKIAEAFIYQNPDSARFYLERSIPLARKTNFPKGEARAMILAAIRAEAISDFDEALDYNEKALVLYQELKDSVFIANVLSNLGIIHEAKGEKETGIEYHMQALSIFQQFKNRLGLYKTYNNLGILFRSIGEPDKAIEYYRLAGQELIQLEIELRENNKNYDLGRGALKNNIANIYFDLAQFDSSLVNAREAHSLYKKTGVEQYEPNALEVIGSSLLMQKQYQSAIDTFQLAVKLSQKYGNLKEQALIQYRLSQAYNQKGNSSKAIELGRNSLSNAKKVESLEDIRNAHSAIADAANSLGNYKMAFDNQRFYKQYSDSVLNLEKVQAIAEIDTKFKTAEKEKTIAEQKLTLAEQEVDIKEQQANIAWLGGGVLVLLMGGIIFYIQNRAQQKAQLQEAIITEQERGIEAIFQATEEERVRIAKDLHDGVGQKLSALKMGFEQLIAKANLAEGSAQIKTLIDETARDTRNISHQMMPKTLTELGLAPAVEDSLAKTLGATHIQWNFEHFNLQERYESAKEIALYRILQELINNVIKHSEASEVDIQLFQNGQSLLMVVEDNGKGMDSQTNEGHGLLNIKNRLKTFQGKANFESELNQGTTITISLPA